MEEFLKHFAAISHWRPTGANPDGLDAIQIEIESILRTNERRCEVFIEDLAHAISSLVSRYAEIQTMSGDRSAKSLPRLQRG